MVAPGPQCRDFSNGLDMQTLCFIVDDEPAIGRFIALALHNLGEVAVEQFIDLPSMTSALGQRVPDLIFLDVSLGASDGIEAIRHLSATRYAGVVQLMSGRDAFLLEDVRLIGERHGLRMRPALTKPFRVDAIKAIVDEERLLFGGTHAQTADKGARADGDRQQPPKVSLRKALDERQVEIWYQPKIDLQGNRTTGAEGLARIRHPEHGIVYPASFIPEAGKADLAALAECALRTALRDATDFAAAGHSLRLAINIPVEALVALPIAAIVRDARPSGNAWTGIILEVTEDQIIRDIPAAHEIATQLRIHQIGLSLDDFGSGYSSLARLKELPFEELKLDRSFVAGCSTDTDNAALCKTAIELAHRFGSLAVAEGVETLSDLATLRRLGCDMAQGFLFAKAMPKDSLVTRMAANGTSDGFASPPSAAPGRPASA
jgi:EAL domain-containing protein (putative c-di-GMP-specific phosphodiesterase class I)/FixJ family two-component response regulator